MTGNQGYSIPPIKWDDERDEPYCEVEIKGQPYLMTMWRESDGDDMVRNWNHPLIGKWSYRRPFPYTHEHLKDTFDMFLIPDRAHIQSYKSFVKDPSSKPPKQCILRALRTTEGKIVGNAFLLAAKEEKDGVEKEVNEIGYDLDVDYWGKGLGKFMVQFLVNWAGWVGLETIFATVDSTNSASQNVLKANGFEIAFTRKANMPEDKGGRECEISQWVRKL